MRTWIGRIGRRWSLKGEAGRGVITLSVDGLWGHSPGLEIELLLRGIGPSFLFPKAVETLVRVTGESSVPKETPGLAGEPQGGVSILGAMGEGARV